MVVRWCGHSEASEEIPLPPYPLPPDDDGTVILDSDAEEQP